MTQKTILQIQNLAHQYVGRPVLVDINLTINQGDFVSIVGPSGCGKSTLLQTILGTLTPTVGYVYLDGNLITRPTRDVGIVYQNYAESIYDFLTAEENVSLGLKLDQSTFLDRTLFYFSWRKRKKSFIKQARELLVKLKLQDALKHYPSELSGGMKQRVAIAQALIMRPKVLLLDEPFSGLDVKTRKELQQMLLALYQENQQALAARQPPPHTIILITHELNEAFHCANRVIGLSKIVKDGQNLGATIVYDKLSKIASPDHDFDSTVYLPLIAELSHTVFHHS